MGWIHGNEDSIVSGPNYSQEQRRKFADNYQGTLAAKKALLERWEEMGQYIRIGSFCFPFSFKFSNEGEILLLRQDGEWNSLYMADFGYRSVDHGGQEYHWAYRRESADDGDPWVSHQEYKKQYSK